MGPQESEAEETLAEAALRVLNTADPVEKARLGDSLASRWLNGAIALPYHRSRHLPVPDRPARLSNVSILSPSNWGAMCLMKCPTHITSLSFFLSFVFLLAGEVGGAESDAEAGQSGQLAE